MDTSQNVLIILGQQTPDMLANHEYWRFLTAMFLHYSLIHVALNMLSLFFIGRVVEVLYGSWRYLLIYFAAGIVGGIATLILDPLSASAGASGAIFGIFGALGMFYFLNRQTLGVYSRGAISNWVFWLVLNLVWGFSGGIAIWDHIGGLIAGLILGWLLLPSMGRRRI
jgi:rhomboid protease GluP